MKYLSLPNALLITSVISLITLPSVITLGLVFFLVLHANATRFSRFKRQEQVSSLRASSEAQEARIKLVEDEIRKVVGASSFTKLNGRG